MGNSRQGHWFPSAGTGGFLGGPLGGWIGITLGDGSASITQAVLTFRTAMQQSGGKFANGAAGSAFAAIQDLDPMWGEVAGVLAEVAIPGYGLYSCAEGGDCDWADWSLAGVDSAVNAAKLLTGIGAVATVAVVGYRLYKLRKATKSAANVTKRPSGFRKKTVKDAWDNAGVIVKSGVQRPESSGGLV